MRDLLVRPEFDEFRIDKNHPQFIGGEAVEKRADERVHEHALAGAGLARAKQMRHPRKIRKIRLAADVLAHHDRDRMLFAVKIRMLQKLLEINRLARLARHLDAHDRLARQRGKNAHALRRKRH